MSRREPDPETVYYGIALMVAVVIACIIAVPLLLWSGWENGYYLLAGLAAWPFGIGAVMVGSQYIGRKR